MKIITVSREFGSGGRELGKRLADELGFAYYDREIITGIAKNCAMDEDYIERTIENHSVRRYPLTYARTFSAIPPFSVNQASLLLVQQGKVIQELAAQGDCVVVGRGADKILKEQNPLKIFVYADMPSKIARCRAREDGDERLTDREMERKIRQVDKARADTYSLISSADWGSPHNYNLCINTTDMDLKRLIPLLSVYAREWKEGTA